MARHKNRFGTIAHVATGIVLSLKGYIKITDHHALVGSIILCFGLAIIGYVVYEKRQKIHSRHLVVAVHLFEGLALLFTTYVYINEGKTYIQYLTFAAAIGFFTGAFLLYRKTNKINFHAATITDQDQELIEEKMKEH